MIRLAKESNYEDGPRAQVTLGAMLIAGGLFARVGFLSETRAAISCLR